jgi:hypothetical protein
MDNGLIRPLHVRGLGGFGVGSRQGIHLLQEEKDLVPSEPFQVRQGAGDDIPVVDQKI